MATRNSERLQEAIRAVLDGHAGPGDKELVLRQARESSEFCEQLGSELLLRKVMGHAMLGQNRENCPELGHLEAYVAAKLTPPETQRTKQHLHTCPACAAEVYDIRVLREAFVPYLLQEETPETQAIWIYLAGPRRGRTSMSGTMELARQYGLIVCRHHGQWRRLSSAEEPQAGDTVVLAFRDKGKILDAEALAFVAASKSPFLESLPDATVIGVVTGADAVCVVEGAGYSPDKSLGGGFAAFSVTPQAQGKVDMAVLQDWYTELCQSPKVRRALHRPMLHLLR
jgi:hypothetical protein